MSTTQSITATKDNDQRVTIYYLSRLGFSIARAEGKLVRISKREVAFVPKGHRREKRMNLGRCAYILVVRGWGRPDAPSGWEPLGSDVAPDWLRSKYTMASREIVNEFRAATITESITDADVVIELLG